MDYEVKFGKVDLAAGTAIHQTTPKKIKQTTMKAIEPKNCQECPFSNQDNEYGMNQCNLSIYLDRDIKLLRWEELPINEVHHLCPLKNHKVIII